MIELTVCIGTSCHLRGAEKVIKTFQQQIISMGMESKVDLKGTFCMGKCLGESVVVSVNKKIFETTPENANAFFHSNVCIAVK